VIVAMSLMLSLKLCDDKSLIGMHNFRANLEFLFVVQSRSFCIVYQSIIISGITVRSSLYTHICNIV